MNLGKRNSGQAALLLGDVYVYGNEELEGSGKPPRLNNVAFRLNPGEWVTVVGVNGSGKSTLARLLAGLLQDGLVGKVERGFAGERSSPIVLQQPSAQLFGETPREEVQFALEWRGFAADQMDILVQESLARSGLIRVADEPWSRLSGGQQQLAAIAASTAGAGEGSVAGEASTVGAGEKAVVRASSSDGVGERVVELATSLIVFDEVTSMLDEANRSAVMCSARELQARGVAVVWVSQRLDELEADDRVLALSEGSLLFDGCGREFLYGVEGEPSPCESSGLRLPYMARMALELRKTGKLKDPLPVNAEQWRKVMGKR
jgi:energy-coupling factor transport system ATP-binding protein